MNTMPKFVLGILAVGVIAVAATFPWWRTWFDGEEAEPPAAHAPHGGESERIKLSPQARANLKLVVKALTPETYQRRIQVPGVVVERRGKGDQSVVAPVTGVVKAIHRLTGDVAEPGAVLLTLRLTSEPLQTSQTELYKTAEEIQITQTQKARLDPLAKSGAIQESRILELVYQLDRLAATRKAYRADLGLKGLLPEQIDQVEKGEFLKEIVVRAPTTAEGGARSK